MKVLTENFSENIRDQIPEGIQSDQFHYKEAEQEKQEDQLIDAAMRKQKGLFNKVLSLNVQNTYFRIPY